MRMVTSQEKIISSLRISYNDALIGISKPTDASPKSRCEKAQKIKTNKDKDWKMGYYWHTTIETKKLTESHIWD